MDFGNKHALRSSRLILPVPLPLPSERGNPRAFPVSGERIASRSPPEFISIQRPPEESLRHVFVLIAFAFFSASAIRGQPSIVSGVLTKSGPTDFSGVSVELREVGITTEPGERVYVSYDGHLRKPITPQAIKASTQSFAAAVRSKEKGDTDRSLKFLEEAVRLNQMRGRHSVLV